MVKLSKGDVINLIPNSKGKIDSAIPIEWSADAKDFGIDPNHYVWDYRQGGAFGKPLNIMAEYVKIQEELNERLTRKINELNEELDESKRTSNRTV